MRRLSCPPKYNFVKRLTFTAVVILQINFGNIADVSTGRLDGLGEISNIWSSKIGFAYHEPALNCRPTCTPM